LASLLFEHRTESLPSVSGGGENEIRKHNDIFYSREREREKKKEKKIEREGPF